MADLKNLLSALDAEITATRAGQQAIIESVPTTPNAAIDAIHASQDLRRKIDDDKAHLDDLKSPILKERVPSTDEPGEAYEITETTTMKNF